MFLHMVGNSQGKKEKNIKKIKRYWFYFLPEIPFYYLFCFSSQYLNWNQNFLQFWVVTLITMLAIKFVKLINKGFSYRFSHILFFDSYLHSLWKLKAPPVMITIQSLEKTKKAQKLHLFPSLSRICKESNSVFHWTCTASLYTKWNWGPSHTAI